jgi:hypothetical protein
METARLVTVAEAQQHTGLSREKLYMIAREAPDGAVFRFGRAIRFDLDRLRAWARTQAEQSRD